MEFPGLTVFASISRPSALDAAYNLGGRGEGGQAASR